MTDGAALITTDLDEIAQRLQMPLEEAMLTQRAVRRLLPDPVDDDIVLRCIELALKAPTGSNGQNWEFVVVKDRATKEPAREATARLYSLGMERGVVFGTSRYAGLGNVVKVKPPLTITRDEMDTVMTVLDDVLTQLEREGA